MTDENDRPTWTPPPEPPADPPGPPAASPEPVIDQATEVVQPPAEPVDQPAGEAEAAALVPPADGRPAPDPAPQPAEAIAPPTAPAAGPPVDPTADQPAAVASGGSGRMRWAVAIGIVALIALGIGLVAVLAGRGGLDATAPRYLPVTTIQYLDVRFDLPGDQRQEVAKLLALFPGFEDASTLDLKADDTFERLVKAATDGKASYTNDIKPWFGGQVAEGVTGLPGLGALITGSGSSGLELPVIGLLSVKDASAAQAAVERLIAASKAAGMTVVSTEVDGHPTWTFSGGDGSNGPRSATVTLTNDMLVVGMDAADVAKSVTLGTQGGANLAGSSAFTDATADLPDARLATIYVDGAALKLAAGALTSVPGLESALAAIPVSIAGALTVQDASIIGTARAVHPDGAPQIVDSASTLAADVPGTALAYAEAHDVGTAISTLLASVKTQPGIEAFGVQVDSIESLLGAKLEDLFAWVGDVAVAGWTTEGTPGGAVVAEVTDASAASERVKQLQAFLQLASIGGSVSTATTTYAGTTITNVTVSDANQDVTVSFALSDTTFVLGIGEASVKAVLDVTPATALAADPGYQATMKAAGPSTNSGSAYVDLHGIRDAIEPLIPAAERNRYEQEIKPWLLPFDQLGAVTYQDGSTSVSQTVITTQQP
jgi:Protein of unknown function (DUF3352)